MLLSIKCQILLINILNHKNISYNLITITGPTASSKTALAANLAHSIESEVISADSRQVYRRMDLGTGKDYEDYNVKGTRVPFHLIDIVEPGYKYNVFEYQRDFLKAFLNITQKGKTPVLCGGTGMYIEAVLKGYKLIHVPVNDILRESLKNKSLIELAAILKSYKTTHNISDVDTRKRAIRAIEIGNFYLEHPEIDLAYPDIKSLIIAVKFDRDSRRSRITERLKSRLNGGMVDEVKGLLESGVSKENLIYYGLEYKFLTQYVCGDISYDEMFKKLETAIHQFSKRQMTWFRGMERKGFIIHWIDGYLPLEEKTLKVLELVNNNS